MGAGTGNLNSPQGTGTSARSIQEIDMVTLRCHAAATFSSSGAARCHRPCQLNGYGLDLRVVLQRRLAVLAALAGLLEAAEWRRRIDDVVAVDPDCPCL